MRQQNTALDSWGFTEADHLELRALMRKYHATLPDVMLLVHQQGIQPQPDDPGMMGWLAREAAGARQPSPAILPNRQDL